MSDIVRVELGERSYDIVIGSGLLRDAAAYIQPLLRSKNVFIGWDENVAPHQKALEAQLVSAGLEVRAHRLPAGEETKCVAHLDGLWDAMSGARYGRDCAVVALGGGVAGDLVGFAAASYLRGVDFIQVPTSLLAMVDSSVGGKTGINNKFGKNLLGAFWQPRLVLADIDVLQTLPHAERVSALAEIIKYGVIWDAEFFAWLEANVEKVRDLEPAALVHAIKRSCEIKAEVVSKDEREGGLREILNFGHTIGHAIENVAGYGAIRHGEAIAIGMVAESMLAIDADASWSGADHDRLVALTERAGLPVRIPAELELKTADLIEATKSDKKTRAGVVRYALPTAMGTMTSAKIDDARAAAVMAAFGAA